MKKESEALSKVIEDMQARLDQATKQREEEKASYQKMAKNRGFEPDIDNKERNLACQFLDYALNGREFQKIELKELTNLKKIGEGAAAVVY